MHIGRLIKILDITIEREMNRQLAQFDLTSTQGRILGFLNANQKNEVCQKDIEQEFSLSHPTMSNILQRMETKEMIFTAPLPQDRRFKKVSLTEKGKSLHQEILNHIEKMETQMRVGLPETKQEELISMLNSLIQNISSLG